MKVVLAAAILLATTSPATAALTEATRLAAIYDVILAADFDRVNRELRTACPPAPEPACKALTTASLWWQIQLDPDSRDLDEALKRVAADAIAASTEWTTREPKRGEAWFYLAGSYAPLVQWRVYRGERLAAARDANRIRAALEKALSLDPSLTDAYFGIGLYHYYADVAPLGAKLLRAVMFLPGGDRRKGMREMLEARDHGVLLRGEADYQLHWLYVWYERQPERALGLLRGLDSRAPTNPVFLRRIAEIERDRGNHRESASAWQELLARADAGRVANATGAETIARLGLGTELVELGETERAIDHLNAVIARHPTRPYGAEALAELELGSALARSHARDRAAAAFTRAIAIAPKDDPANVRARARDGLRAIQ